MPNLRRRLTSLEQWRARQPVAEVELPSHGLQDMFWGIVRSAIVKMLKEAVRSIPSLLAEVGEVPARHEHLEQLATSAIQTLEEAELDADFFEPIRRDFDLMESYLANFGHDAESTSPQPRRSQLPGALGEFVTAYQELAEDAYRAAARRFVAAEGEITPAKRRRFETEPAAQANAAWFDSRTEIARRLKNAATMTHDDFIEAIADWFVSLSDGNDYGLPPQRVTDDPGPPSAIELWLCGELTRIGANPLGAGYRP